MARTFGAASSDRVQYTTTRLATNEANLIAAWVYPTTLTTNRKYWGSSGNYGPAVASTTSELIMTHSRATTASTHTTSGAGMVTNQWQFVCTLSSVGTGTPQWAAWRGTLNGGLRQLTVNTTTAGSGTPQSSTTFIVGNTSGSNSAFQGDIENLVWFHSDAAVGETHPLFHGSAYGSLTADEISNIQELIVEPLFAGRLVGIQYPWSTTGGIERTWFTLDTANTAFQITRGYSSATVTNPLTVTNNGTTLSTRRSPQALAERFRGQKRVRR